jgi:CRP-like cAMP-binding protein
VPIVEIGLLRLTALFAPLPAPELEGVARSLVHVTAPAGADVLVEGAPGDRYYAIAGGTATVTRSGRTVAALGRGDGFGEVALLRDVPRTATITATTDLDLYALEKADFLAAVTGHAQAYETAQSLASERLVQPAPAGEG